MSHRDNPLSLFFFYRRKKSVRQEERNLITTLHSSKRFASKRLYARFELGTLPCDHRNIRNGRKFSPLNFK